MWPVPWQSIRGKDKRILKDATKPRKRAQHVVSVGDTSKRNSTSRSRKQVLSVEVIALPAYIHQVSEALS